MVATEILKLMDLYTTGQISVTKIQPRSNHKWDRARLVKLAESGLAIADFGILMRTELMIRCEASNATCKFYFHLVSIGQLKSMMHCSFGSKNIMNPEHSINLWFKSTNHHKHHNVLKCKMKTVFIYDVLNSKSIDENTSEHKKNTTVLPNVLLAPCIIITYLRTATEIKCIQEHQ